MKTKFERDGNMLIAGDSLGELHESPNCRFVIGWYQLHINAEVRENAYVLFSCDEPILCSTLPDRILDGSVCDSGVFALRHIDEGEQVSVTVFNQGGSIIITKTFVEYVLAYSVHTDGMLLLYSERNKVGCIDLATQETFFSFEVEARFHPSALRLCAQKQAVEIQHADKKWYSFSTEGEFLDRAVWFNDYLEDCDGEILYRVIKELHEAQGVSGEDEAKTYAGWVEEAIRRGIKDSLYVSLSEVYRYLASLYQSAGESQRHAAALEAAEHSMDGFRLVDSVEGQVRSFEGKMDSASATKLIADLERAKNTKRLFEYPNYVGRLFRVKGELLEMLGEAQGAIAAYKAALEANPKAGCAKRLKLLSNCRVIPAAKPKPPAIEDRINFSNLTMFHFRCQLCSGVPGVVKLTEYLNTWNASVEGQFKDMLQFSSAVASTMPSRKTFKSKKFDVACQAFITAIQQNFGTSEQDESFLSSEGKGLWMHKDCHVCKMSAGARQQDNYFTHWGDCCRVQGSNLFFEVGVVCLGLNHFPARWMNSDLVQFSKQIASLAFSVCEAMGLSSCPRCGRFTTAIFGGSRANPEEGMCRWCLDHTGASQITIHLDLDKIVKDEVRRLSEERRLW